MVTVLKSSCFLVKCALWKKSRFKNLKILLGNVHFPLLNKIIYKLPNSFLLSKIRQSTSISTDVRRKQKRVFTAFHHNSD